MNTQEIDRLDEANYQCPKGEEQCYHVVIEVKQFDPKTGERISRPVVQKFGKKIFESAVRESLLTQGYEMRILHDPNRWNEKGAEEREQAARALEAERKKAEREALKAEILAEIEKEKKRK